jgi:hypothetical protein
MKWSDVDISFEPEDHPETELSERNLPFVVKLPIGRHSLWVVYDLPLARVLQSKEAIWWITRNPLKVILLTCSLSKS